MQHGKFITIEGPEGSGKSTHSRLLCAYLRRKGFRIVHTREPGGTRISESIRNVLLSRKNKGMADACELLLFMAARAQIVNEVIRPALKKGYIVVCDRFHDATVAYQGYGAGMDLKVIESLRKLATGGLKPDLTVLLDVESRAGLRRGGVSDRMEVKSLSFHKKVRDGYLKLAKKEPRRIKVINTTYSAISEIQRGVRKAVEDAV
ncbi:MAG: dTMP kinase [Candidatus Omnitrophota bacterium]